jgi:hypothetical protein
LYVAFQNSVATATDSTGQSANRHRNKMRVATLLLASLACLCIGVVSVSALQQFRPDEPSPPTPAGWYWGAVDANIDWCERNYDTSIYVAEFWNALSSIPITLFALAGYILGAKHARIETRSDRQENRLHTGANTQTRTGPNGARATMQNRQTRRN